MGKDYVVIGDKALPQMHVLVYRRAKVLAPGEQRLVCAVPVFQPGQSFTENSVMATDRSIVLENNAGYDRDPKVVEQGRTTKPGFVRVDINEDGSGCHSVWTNEEINPILAPKVSLATGLIYALTKPRGPANTDAWYFTAIDFATGDVVYKVLAGPGRLWNSHMGAVYLDRTGAAFYGTLGGMVKIQDGPPD